MVPAAPMLLPHPSTIPSPSSRIRGIDIRHISHARCVPPCTFVSRSIARASIRAASILRHSKVTWVAASRSTSLLTLGRSGAKGGTKIRGTRTIRPEIRGERGDKFNDGTCRDEERHVRVPPHLLFCCSEMIGEMVDYFGTTGPKAKRMQGGTKSSNGPTTADSRHSSRPTTHTCGKRPDERVQTRPRARSSSRRHELVVLWKKRTYEKKRTRTTNATDANRRGRFTTLPRARRPLTRLLQEDRNVHVLSTTVEKDLRRFARVCPLALSKV